MFSVVHIMHKLTEQWSVLTKRCLDKQDAWSDYIYTYSFDVL